MAIIKNNWQNSIAKGIYGILILAVIILAFSYHSETRLFYSSPETIKQYIEGFGILAPVMFIAIYTLKAVFFIIPTTPFAVAGGYLFGAFLGTIYSLISITLGSAIVFCISRKFSRSFAEKAINNRELKHFDVFFKKRGKAALFIARATPELFPTDAVSFAAGLAKIRFKDYLLLTFLGSIPNMLVLNLFGTQLSHGLSPTALVILIVLVLIILGYLFRHRLRVLFIKEIREYEEGIKGIEKKSLKGIKALKYDIKYEFHKWKKQLLIADKIFTLAIVLFLGIYRPDYVVIAAYFLLIPYLILTQRKSLFYHLLAASLVAVAWMLIAKKQYGYNHEFLTLLGINLYPLFAWAVGLFLIYVLYSHYEHMINEKGYAKQLLLFAAIYIPMLIAVETLAYHAFDIHNVATEAFPGLPICDCIHAPRWMQLAYFAMGPIFFSLCYILKLENPHFKMHYARK